MSNQTPVMHGMMIEELKKPYFRSVIVNKPPFVVMSRDLYECLRTPELRRLYGYMWE